MASLIIGGGDADAEADASTATAATAAAAVASAIGWVPAQLLKTNLEPFFDPWLKRSEILHRLPLLRERRASALAYLVPVRGESLQERTWRYTQVLRDHAEPAGTALAWTVALTAGLRLLELEGSSTDGADDGRGRRELGSPLGAVSPNVPEGASASMEAVAARQTLYEVPVCGPLLARRLDGLLLLVDPRRWRSVPKGAAGRRLLEAQGRGASTDAARLRCRTGEISAMLMSTLRPAELEPESLHMLKESLIMTLFDPAGLCWAGDGDDSHDPEAQSDSSDEDELKERRSGGGGDDQHLPSLDAAFFRAMSRAEDDLRLDMFRRLMRRRHAKITAGPAMAAAVYRAGALMGAFPAAPAYAVAAQAEQRPAGEIIGAQLGSWAAELAEWEEKISGERVGLANMQRAAASAASAAASAAAAASARPLRASST